MTAHELARRLLAMPDLMVTVRGYEDGVDEVTVIGPPAPLRLKAYSQWYYGEHEYVNEGTTRVIQAIHLTTDRS